MPQNWRKFLFAVVCMMLLANALFAQKETKVEKEKREAGERAKQAAKVFNSIMGKSDKAIPRELLARAEAVAVFPNLLNAAFIIGGRGGEGLISRRTATGWSAPAFFNFGGASFGFQIGGEKVDYVMLFMNDGGVKGLLEDKFEFGGDAGIAAGPIGREASATTNTTLDAAIFSYSRSRGAFAGVSLKGAVISPDKNRNAAMYGKTAKELLTGDENVPMPNSVKDFPDTLNRFSTRAGIELKTDKTRQRTVTTEGNNSDTSATPSPDTVVVGAAKIPAPEIFAVEKSARLSNRTAQSVRSELLSLADYGVFDWLEFQISDAGELILRGQTTTATMRNNAAAALDNVAEIKSLQNEIEVLPASKTDDELRAALFRAIYSGQLARFAMGATPPIHIIVKNGVVTLKGFAGESDRNFAAAQAANVENVVEIRNEIRVSTEQP